LANHRTPMPSLITTLGAPLPWSVPDAKGCIIMNSGGFSFQIFLRKGLAWHSRAPAHRLTAALNEAPFGTALSSRVNRNPAIRAIRLPAPSRNQHPFLLRPKRRAPNRALFESGDFDGAVIRDGDVAPLGCGGERCRPGSAIVAVYDGMSREDAARIGGMDRQTLRDWLHRFNRHGVEGLIDGQSPGRPSKLSAEQKEELRQLVEAGPDLDKDGVVRWRCVDLKRSLANALALICRK
jgi:hypothetical protein